jgi:hypothetical protein
MTNMHAMLTRMIDRWEQSGNGDGGMLDTEENPEFGSLDNRTLEALHNRATFLPGGKNSYLLIFWDLSEGHQLLASSLQRLDKSVGASDTSSVPVVYGLSRPNTPSTASPIPSAHFDATINEVIGNFSANMSAKMEESTLAFESNDLDDAHSRNRQAYFASNNQEAKNYIDKMLEKIERKMEENTIKRRRLSYERGQRN